MLNYTISYSIKNNTFKYSPLERRGDVGADNCSGSPSPSVDMVTCSRGTKMKSGITGNDPVGRKCARAYTRITLIGGRVMCQPIGGALWESAPTGGHARVLIGPRPSE